MSASNWGACPECLKREVRKCKDLIDSVSNAYAAVSEEEYLKMRDEALSTSTEKHEDTLREDYEIGVDSNGEFTIYYRCSCEKCGFEFNFEERKMVTEDK